VLDPANAVPGDEESGDGLFAGIVARVKDAIASVNGLVKRRRESGPSYVPLRDMGEV